MLTGTQEPPQGQGGRTARRAGRCPVHTGVEAWSSDEPTWRELGGSQLSMQQRSQSRPTSRRTEPAVRAVLDPLRGSEDECQDDETDLQVNQLPVRRAFKATTQWPVSSQQLTDGQVSSSVEATAREKDRFMKQNQKQEMMWSEEMRMLKQLPSIMKGFKRKHDHDKEMGK